jgi:hypothetical protein
MDNEIDGECEMYGEKRNKCILGFVGTPAEKRSFGRPKY